MFARSGGRLEGYPRARSVLFGVLVVVAGNLSAFAAGPSGSDENGEDVGGGVLRVGVREAAPFGLRDEEGDWSGVAAGLWEMMAERAGLEYEFVPYGLAEMLEGLRTGELDVGVAALSVTAERERSIEFTHPFMQAGLAIAAEGSPAGWGATVKKFFSPGFLKALAALGAILLVFGVLIWLVERKRNEQFQGTAMEGVGSGFWWSAVTMTTVGYGDKAPITPIGRVVGLVWMFAAVMLISGFTATIASSLTVGSLQTRIGGLGDLRQARTGALEESSAAAFLESRRIGYDPYPTIEKLLEALDEGDLDAVVHDAPILRFELESRAIANVGLLPQALEKQFYAFGLPKDSPLRDRLNLALLEVVQSSEWENLQDRFLGKDPVG